MCTNIGQIAVLFVTKLCVAITDSGIRCSVCKSREGCDGGRQELDDLCEIGRSFERKGAVVLSSQGIGKLKSLGTIMKVFI